MIRDTLDLLHGDCPAVSQIQSIWHDLISLTSHRHEWWSVQCTLMNSCPAWYNVWWWIETKRYRWQASMDHTGQIEWLLAVFAICSTDQWVSAKKTNITPLLTHWSYIFLSLTHWNDGMQSSESMFLKAINYHSVVGTHTMCRVRLSSDSTLHKNVTFTNNSYFELWSSIPQVHARQTA